MAYTVTSAYLAAHQKPASILSILLKGFEVSRQRRALAAMDTVALSDLGLTREQAQREAKRSFWDIPQH